MHGILFVLFAGAVIRHYSPRFHTEQAAQIRIRIFIKLYYNVNLTFHIRHINKLTALGNAAGGSTKRRFIIFVFQLCVWSMENWRCRHVRCWKKWWNANNLFGYLARSESGGAATHTQRMRMMKWIRWLISGAHRSAKPSNIWPRGNFCNNIYYLMPFHFVSVGRWHWHTHTAGSFVFAASEINYSAHSVRVSEVRWCD